MTEKIIKVLKTAFHCHHLEVIDESRQHAGHAGAKQSAGGHYIVNIVADEFRGKSHLQRHRMVNDALKPLRNGIHALALTAKYPEE